MTRISKLFRGIVITGAALGVGACGGSDGDSDDSSSGGSSGSGGNARGGSGGGSSAGTGGRQSTGGTGSGGSNAGSGNQSSGGTGGGSAGKGGAAGSGNTGGSNAGSGGSGNPPVNATDCPHTQQFFCTQGGDDIKTCMCNPNAPLTPEDCRKAGSGGIDFTCESDDPPTGCKCMSIIR